MSEIVQKLFALQQLQFGPGAKDAASRMTQLRKTISPDILIKYDRFAIRGKKPVAVVQNGVCMQCHIRLAVGSMFALNQGMELSVCDSCGRFLYCAPEQHAAAAAPTTSPAKSARGH